MVAGPADRAAEPVSSSTTTTVRAVAAGPVRWDVLGLGSWEGARVASSDGRELLVVFVGAREYNPEDGCSVDYRIAAEEIGDEVRVRIGAVENPPLPEGFGCTMEGHRRHVRVRLAEPLGDRRVVEAQYGRRQAVLRQPSATVGWVPDGWREAPEGPSHWQPTVESSTEEGQRTLEPHERNDETLAWMRSWAPEPPPAANGRCTPGAAGILLSEGPTAIARHTDAAGAEHHDVNGHQATYIHEGRGGEYGTARLSWVAGDRGYIVETRTGCQGDTLSPVEEMLRFARAIRTAS